QWLALRLGRASSPHRGAGSARRAGQPARQPETGRRPAALPAQPCPAGPTPPAGGLRGAPNRLAPGGQPLGVAERAQAITARPASTVVTSDTDAVPIRAQLPGLQLFAYLCVRRL